MKKTIARVGHFTVTPNVGTNEDTYGEIDWLESEKSGGREYSAEPVGEITEVFADGKKVLSVDENNGYDIKLVLLSLLDDVAVAWFNRKRDSVGGLSEYANAGEYPRFGLAIHEETVDGAGALTIYYNCQATKRPTKAGKTTEGKFEAQFAEMQISARPRAKDTLICHEKAGMERPTTVPEPETETVPDAG